MRFKKPFWIIALIFLLTLAAASAETCIYVFHGDGCSHCAKVMPHIEELQINPDLNIEIFEIYNNLENRAKLNELFDEFKVPPQDRGIPVVFIHNEYLIGDKPILEHLDEKIKEHKGHDCPEICSADSQDPTGSAGDSSPTEKLTSLSLVTVIGAALVDSINPCAIAVLLILIGALLATGNKRRALQAGLAFTVSIYIVYFLFGLGLFSAIQISGLSYWFYKIIGGFAIAIGLLNIKDYFWYGGGGFAMEIPKRWRPTLKRLLHSVTSPLGAFLMGFVVCLFELPCTGGPYLFILGLLAEKSTRMGAIPILLLYNLVFILPLIIITFMVFVGMTNVDKANEWKDKNIKVLHLIAGIIMLALGTLVVSGLV